MRSARWFGRRQLRRAGAIGAAVVVLAGLTSTIAAQTGRKERPVPVRGAQPAPDPPEVCQPVWPSPPLSGISSYYSVVVQLQNCQAADIPLSLDIGPDEGTGTSLTGAGGVAATGAGVVWNAGTGTTSTTPVTAIPKGDGIGGVGSLVGFTTVPYWDGQRAAMPGPYANQISADGSINTQSMRGTWSLYLPSATFEFDLQPPLPFPYVPQFYLDGDPNADPPIPGALFTGLLVTRSRPGGLQDPIFTTSSPLQNYGQSPPSSSFVPGNCYDPVSLVNGANAGYTTASNWSFQGVDENSKKFQFTPAANTFDPLTSFQWPVLMLVTGFVDTESGEVGEVALRDPINSVTSTTPHYLQIAVRNIDGVDCSGNLTTFDIPVAIGADLGGINLASAQLPGAVLANSDLTNASLTQISLAAGTGDTDPNLSYANLSGGTATSTTPTPAIGADFEAAQLIGTNLSNMTLTRAGFKNTNLLLANLSGSTIDQADFGGANFCRTTWIDGSIKNDDCATLLTPQTPGDPDTSGCDPLTCVYVSLYNNTTRTLARGLDWCVDGQFAQQPEAPTWIGPLVTGQFGLQKATTGSSNTINCGVTFANGANGKIRVKVDTSSGSVVATTDAGTCFGATSDACLPRAANGTDPVKVSTNLHVTKGATRFDVIVCEPAAFTAGACSATAALPCPPQVCPVTGALPGE